MDEQLFDSKNWTSLIGTYAVDEENQNDFTYLVKNTHDSSVAYFSVKVIGKGVNIQESRWSYICGIKS